MVRASGETGEAMSDKAKCKVCGGVIYGNNKVGVCSRTEPCRVERARIWSKVGLQRWRREHILEAIPWTIGLHPVPDRRKPRHEA